MDSAFLEMASARSNHRSRIQFGTQQNYSLLLINEIKKTADIIQEASKKPASKNVLEANHGPGRTGGSNRECSCDDGIDITYSPCDGKLLLIVFLGFITCLLNYLLERCLR